MKELHKKEVFNPSFTTTVLFAFGIFALVILLLCKFRKRLEIFLLKIL